MELCLAQDLKQTLSKIFAVYENDSLCHRADFKHIFNELWLLALVTPKPELLDVVQLQQLLANVDLLSFLNHLANRFFYFLGVRCAEENVLHFVRQLLDNLGINFFDSLNLFFLLEEEVCFVDYNTLQMAKIQLGFAALEVVHDLADR